MSTGPRPPHRQPITTIRRGLRFRPHRLPVMSADRLSALLDGIFAIAATLLVLNIPVPEHPAPGQLAHALGHIVGAYAAYAVGFLEVSAIWIGFRRGGDYIRGVDHYATVLLLLAAGALTLTPFTTAVLAQAFDDSANLATAVHLTAGTLTAAAALYAIAARYVIWRGLEREGRDRELADFMLLAAQGLWIVPAIALALSWVSAVAALAVIVVFLVMILVVPAEGYAEATESTEAERA